MLMKANRPGKRMFLKDVPKGLENAKMERAGKMRQKGPKERTSMRLKIVNAATYVGRMTKAANEAKRHACQGLHKGSDLAYGFRARCL
jgi:hypothetical protein